MLFTRKQIKDLRKQIVLNSLFLDDYKNDLFIECDVCERFFSAYIDYLCEIANDEKMDILDIFKKYDTISNLYAFYHVNSEMLYQSDYIASKPVNNFDILCIYQIDSEYIYVAFLSRNDYTGYLCNEKIQKRKLYQTSKDAYFNYYGIRYKLSDFIKKDFMK